MVYDYVILLCASTSKDSKFDELSSDGSYLGGQIRMQAAVDFYKTRRVKKFIVVGGGVEKKDDKDKWHKVQDMWDFLVDNGVPKENIIRICSLPDTHGNLRAVYILLSEKLKNKIIGIFTNFYHLPRVMRFANDPQFDWNVRFIPVCAESFITTTPTTYLNHQGPFFARIFNDIQGLKDWEKLVYRDQNIPQEEWRGEIYPADYKKI